MGDSNGVVARVEGSALQKVISDGIISVSVLTPIWLGLAMGHSGQIFLSRQEAMDARYRR